MTLDSRWPLGNPCLSTAFTSDGTESDRVRKATEIILRDRDRDREPGVGPEQVTAHACLSARQPTRQFKDKMGVSPSQDIAAAQIDSARELLSGTGQPLEKTALRWGFSGRRRLSRVFAKASGMAPAEFRERFTPSTQRPRQQ